MDALMPESKGGDMPDYARNYPTPTTIYLPHKGGLAPTLQSPTSHYPTTSGWTQEKWLKLQPSGTRTAFQWQALDQTDEIIIYKWMKFTDQPNFNILVTEQVYKNAVDENNTPYTDAAAWIVRWQNCIAGIHQAGDNWDPTKPAALPGYSITGKWP